MRKSMENLAAKAQAAATPEVETYTAKKRGNPDADLYKSTFFIPRAVYKVLREHAVLHETSIQQIQLEALDKWLVDKTGKTIADITGESNS